MPPRKDLQPSGAENNKLTLPGYSSKRRIAGLAIFILKKISIWARYLAWARRAIARPINTLLSSEQQRNHHQEKLCSAHASKTQILLELLGPSCRPHIVQFSRLYWLHRLTMVWDRDVRKPGGSKKIYLYIIRRHLHTYGYGPSGSLLSTSQNKVISWILMFVHDVNNARRHG